MHWKELLCGVGIVLLLVFSAVRFTGNERPSVDDILILQGDVNRASYLAQEAEVNNRALADSLLWWHIEHLQRRVARLEAP